jgi:hypothetical protein
MDIVVEFDNAVMFQFWERAIDSAPRARNGLDKQQMGKSAANRTNEWMANMPLSRVLASSRQPRHLRRMQRQQQDNITTQRAESRQINEGTKT